ncbi:MAG: hypothetical protein ACLVK1_02945, partial [Lachnospiraceae bacterium]
GIGKDLAELLIRGIVNDFLDLLLFFLILFLGVGLGIGQELLHVRHRIGRNRSGRFMGAGRKRENKK